MTLGARAIGPLLGVALLSAASGAARNDEPYRVLRAVGGFSASELEGLERGEPLAKVLDTDRREIAIVGGVRINAPFDPLFEGYRDVSRLRSSHIVQEAGAFGKTPTADDLRSLTFEDYDLQTIRDCRPGDCGVRLPDTAMQRMQREVDWNAADWRERASSLWRRLLADYVAAYEAHGHEALAQYRNKEVPLSVPQEFAVLFGESELFRSAAPECFRYLREFPHAPLDGAEDLFYWSKEDFGLRPVVSLTHQTLYAAASRASQSQPAAVIATQRFYATHYFDAALGLTFVFSDGPSGFYLVALDRARTRSLTSFTRGLVRGVVQRRSRDAMQKILLSTKSGLERPSRGRPSPRPGAAIFAWR
ncbi:MAG: hypothetical protein DMF86_05880 [Acidobacteria bacterium]|nr:MAG: hypothetical protein DMF86_05880 [Acidobacteriota bacterium]